MVSFRPHGRMGNFLYMAAHIFGFAKKHGLEYSMPNNSTDPIWNPLFLQHLVSPNYIPKEDILINENWNEHQQFNDYQFKEEWRDKNVVFNGYNQSYKYWDFCRQEMLRAFDFPWAPIPNIISIHVRRGDYLLYPTKHPVITIEYLTKAVDIFRQNGYKHFKFHSDDIQWCVACGLNLHFPDCDFEFSQVKGAIQNLISMSECEGQICSNSTLALWGAELNQNPKKMIVVPNEKNWFGPDNPYTVKDLYRPEWIRVSYPLNYWTKDKGFITVE